MDDPFAVAASGHSFKGPFIRWNMAYYGIQGPEALALTCKHHWTEKTLDMSITKYADDIVNGVVGAANTPLSSLAEISISSLAKLDEHLAPCYAQTQTPKRK